VIVSVNWSQFLIVILNQLAKADRSTNVKEVSGREKKRPKRKILRKLVKNLLTRHLKAASNEIELTKKTLQHRMKSLYNI
jgi:hypothetical protein